MSPKTECKISCDPKAIEQRIRLRAYNLYRSRAASGVDGCPIDDWVTAEQQVREEIDQGVNCCQEDQKQK